MNPTESGFEKQTPEERLIDHMRQHHGLIIAELTAEKAIELSRSMAVVSLRGRDTRSGLPGEILLSADEIVRACGG